MRALIQKWQQQAAESTSSNSNFGLTLGNFNSESVQSKLVPDFECKPVARSTDQSVGSAHGHMGTVMNHLGYQSSLSTSPEPFFPSQITVEPIGQPKNSPLLLNMMGEQQKAKKRRRSKVGDSNWAGRSPKRKMSTEEDLSEDTQGSYDSLGATATEAMDFIEDSGADAGIETFEFEDESQASDSNDELRRKLKRARLESRKNSASSTDSKNSSDNHQAFDSMEGKSSLVGPSVSITPIPTPTEPPISSMLNMGLEKRPGIEILPIGSNATPLLPSSITITPIKSEDRSKERSSSSSRDEKSKSRDKKNDDKKLEKKKKRHRDEEGMDTGKLMGPPQVPGKDKTKSDVKPSKPSTPPSTSPPLQRKYPTSPTHLSPGGSNSSMKPQLSMVKTPSSPTQKIKSHSNSPKHSSSSSGSSSSSSSPIYGSPKHSAVSPKHSSPSPKQSSSGKPSMSALKSASSGSMSSSSSKSSSSSSDPNRVKKDKDKKSSSSSSSSNSSSGHSPKNKSSSSSKSKQDFSLSGGDVPSLLPSMTSAQKVVASLLDLDQVAVTSVQKSGTLVSDYLAESPPHQSAHGATSLPATSAQLLDNQTCSTSAKCQQVRNRKGSLSAVIDKLKSAQTSPDLPERKDSDKPKSSSSQKSSDSKNGVKNSEYMVKSSSDGIKITINKTKKDSSSKSSSSYKSSSSLPSSPKHTGLKPGVISGPASKKPQQKSNSSSSSRNSSPSSSKQSSSSKSISGSLSPSTSKSSSSKSSSLFNSSPKSSSSDKSRYKSEKSSSKDRRSSPSTFREDHESERAFKILAAQAKLDIEMPKLDTKFQIPKLSRSESKEGDKKPDKDKHLEPKVEIKKLEEREKPRSFSPSPANNLKMNPVVSLPMLPRTESPFKISERDFEKKVDSPKITPKPRDLDNSLPPDLSSQLSEIQPKLSETPLSRGPYGKHNSETPNNKCDSDSNDSSPGLLIDFSMDKKSMKGSPPPPNLTPSVIPKSPLPVHLPPVLSPSVSVHIVKSPAPSPLILPSPHSSQPSPCITDDELMDEALVGLGK